MIFGSGISFASDSAPSSAWKPSPTGAALRSLVFPGWGQAYVQKPVKAVIYGGIEYSLLYGIVRQHKLFQYYDRIDDESRTDFYRNNRNQLIWYLTGALIVAVMDAYVDAHLFDFDVSDDLTFNRQDRYGFSGVKLNLRWRFR